MKTSEERFEEYWSKLSIYPMDSRESSYAWTAWQAQEAYYAKMREKNERLTKQLEVVSNEVFKWQEINTNLEEENERLKKDLEVLEENTSKVFYDVTNGKISKPFTCAEDVIAVDSDEVNDLVEKETEDLRKELDAIRAENREFAQANCDLIKENLFLRKNPKSLV